MGEGRVLDKQNTRLSRDSTLKFIKFLFHFKPAKVLMKPNLALRKKESYNNPFLVYGEDLLDPNIDIEDYFD